MLFVRRFPRHMAYGLIFRRCSLHSVSIRLHGAEQQADVGLISDAIYRARSAWKSNSILSATNIARTRSHLRSLLVRIRYVSAIYEKLNDRRVYHVDKKRETERRLQYPCNH